MWTKKDLQGMKMGTLGWKWTMVINWNLNFETAFRIFHLTVKNCPLISVENLHFLLISIIYILMQIFGSVPSKGENLIVKAITVQILKKKTFHKKNGFRDSRWKRLNFRCRSLVQFKVSMKVWLFKMLKAITVNMDF